MLPMEVSLPPSLFNDVLGPVMRGPSSSHSAAALRIGLLARDLMGGLPAEVQLDLDEGGSLPTTYEAQGSALGLHGGLLGWEADDARLPQGAEALAEAGCKVEVRVASLGDPHPNTYRLTLHGEGRTHRLVATSVGGGMIHVVELEGAAVSLRGDRPVQVLAFASEEEAQRSLVQVRASQPEPSPGTVVRAEPGALMLLEGGEPLEPPPNGVLWSRTLRCVLPVSTPSELSLPFRHASELTQHGDPTTLRLSEFALAYEVARSGLTEAALEDRARHLLGIMRSGVEGGLAGTHWEDRLLPVQSAGYREALDAGRLHGAGVLDRMILFVTALMETKSSMGVIVAAPTAGSCATFPGALLAAADACEATEEDLVRGILTGGLIGAFVAARSSFAAEVGGCQAETGAGAAMAAAALVELAGGTAERALSAASQALQNVLGLVCDPIANRVEAPCLGRNVTGAANALAAANMALAGYDHLVPFDEVLDAHRAISERMHRDLRCTALGGLSVTPTSRALEARLGGAGSCGTGGCGAAC